VYGSSVQYPFVYSIVSTHIVTFGRPFDETVRDAFLSTDYISDYDSLVHPVFYPLGVSIDDSLVHAELRADIENALVGPDDPSDELPDAISHFWTHKLSHGLPDILPHLFTNR